MLCLNIRLPATNKLVDVEEGANDVVEPCAAASAIEANIPTPAADTLMNWRTFINSAYYHPNILAHDDVACLKELFHLLGSKINYQSINIMIDLRKVRLLAFSENSDDALWLISPAQCTD